MSKRVLIIYAGVSSEREVSIDGGKNVEKACGTLGYNASLFDTKKGLAALVSEVEKKKPEVIFNALHGAFGEDGTIQGALNMMGVPYTHSGVLASSLAMDKTRAKTMFEKAGIPVAEGVIVRKKDVLKADPMPRPFVIKPNADGSSVDVQIIRKKEDRIRPFAEKEMLVEKYIPGRELTAAVMGDRAIGYVEILTDEKFYDYKAKYSRGGSSHVVPTDLPKKIENDVLRYALKAHRVLGCRGVSRSDFRYDPKTGEVIILELNTQPGMTSVSLVPDIARANGMSYEAVVDWMIRHASCD